MISCQLDGGLGNMMFQIAAMESMAKDHGLQVNYLNVEDHLRNMSEFKRTDTYNPFDYLTVFRNFNWNSKIDYCSTLIEIPFAYIPIVPNDGDCFKGYFQSEKYFKHNREFILNIFNPSSEINSKIIKYCLYLLAGRTTCSIHVRRGDYLNYKDVHFVQSFDYFKRAAQFIGNVDLYVIFSDDIEWCKKNFLVDPFFKNVMFIENEKDYIELFLMSKCTHHICSNSSFSWWGGWLGQNPDKIVIAPKKWWAGYDDDIVPENWIKL